MKKELRKIGFVLVAATSMFALSCGGAEEPVTETPPTEPVVEEPVVIEEPVVVDTAMACEGADACDAAEAPATH